MRKGLPDKKILEAVMRSVEGVPGETAGVAYKDGQGSLQAVMEALDNVHGRSISYIKLNSDLCAIRQYRDEDVVTYYTRMSSIVHLLQQHHFKEFHPGQLENFSKQAFYDGLLEKYQPRVSHIMDDPTKSVSDILVSVRKMEETEDRYYSDRRKDSRSDYRSGSSKPYKSYRDNSNNNNGNNHGRRKDDYGVRVGNPDTGDESSEAETLTEDDKEQLYRDGMYIGITRMAAADDNRTGTCFNCKECGHQWRQCPQALREDLQRAKNREGLNHKCLNKSGEGIAKGGHPSPKGTASRATEATPAQR